MSITLDDKFAMDGGFSMISGTQALTRILISQRRRDRRNGVESAGFISGYRGSPLGSIDSALWRARAFLDAENVRFEPGVNEELAATSVYGTQQLGFFPGARHDGVFSAWYGKGPGVDRAGDALKHGNLAGAAQFGGVLVFAGDDHSAKSSTTAHQSEQALMAALIPVLYPASVGEFLEYGSFGYAMSRFSGLWAGFKCVNDTADATATVNLGAGEARWILPDVDLPPEGLNILQGESQLSMERRTVDFRLPAAQAFIRANRLDRVLRDGRRRSLGIITAGRAALDVIEALDMLGLDARRCEALGIRVLKLAMTWPVEPDVVRQFAEGHDELLIVEDKRAFVEPQVAALLYHLRADIRPSLSGKTEPSGQPLLPQTGELTPGVIASALFSRLIAADLIDEALVEGNAALQSGAAANQGPVATLARMPFFCSGCPHNSSTNVPDGAIALSGIGCHVMAAMMPHRQHVWPVQMGGEGANWIGASPFTKTGHIFQNLGDGTYHHSGSLAIRAAIAAGVNITYKLLFNDAVAMTGGQPVEGQQTPWQIAETLLAEGVRRVVVVAEDPDRYPAGARFPAAVPVRPREDLEAVQRELAAVMGVSVLIFDQVCAAEKRRRRKKGQLEDPSRRIFINDLVCEGCGDCSAKSNCVSVQPLETEFGRKRTIDQSSCNKDFSCVQGFCPSFVTVDGGAVAAGRAPDDAAIPPLPPPPVHTANSCSILIAGIGGTGVVTIGAVLGMAAHIEGRTASIVDVTGLSQKNGAVFSHLRIASTPDGIAAARIPARSADLLLACDMIAAGSAEAVGMLRPGETNAIVNENITPTAGFTIDTNIDFGGTATAARLRALLEPGSLFVEATQIAERLLGDTIGANMFVVGAALQRGLLPVSLEAIEQAIALNGVAVAFNLRALALGRIAVADSEWLASRMSPLDGAKPESSLQISETTTELVARRAEFLAKYQDRAYADHFRLRIQAMAAAERKAAPGQDALTRAAARSLFKLMAIKDEYEVARLYSSAEFRSKLSAQFTGDYRLSVYLAPPLLSAKDPVTGLPRKRQFGPWIFPLFRVLASLRGLRRTMFDPFGYTAERKLERQLLAEYETVLDRIQSELTSDNHEAAVALANYPDRIRGYGHVKERSVPLAEAERDRRLAAFGAARGASVDPAAGQGADSAARTVTARM